MPAVIDERLLKKLFTKTSENVWKGRKKVVIFATAFALKARKEFFERFTYQQVVQERRIKEI